MALLWRPEADRAMAQLETAAETALVARLNELLATLEDDPGDARVRRRRYDYGIWGVVVRDRDDWLLLWELTSGGDVIVQYLGPDI